MGLIEVKGTCGGEKYAQEISMGDVKAVQSVFTLLAQ
jgi:hypothetical protein